MSLKNNGKSRNEELLISSPNRISEEKSQRTNTNSSNLSSKSEANSRDHKISKSLCKMLEKMKTLNLKSTSSNGPCERNDESFKGSRPVGKSYSKDSDPINQDIEYSKLNNIDDTRDARSDNKEFSRPTALTTTEEKRKYSTGIHKPKLGEPYQTDREGEGKPALHQLIEPYNSEQSSEILDNPNENVLIKKSKVSSEPIITSPPICTSQISSNSYGNGKLPDQNITSRNKSRQRLMEEARKFSGLPEPTEEHFRKIIDESLPDSLDDISKSKKTIDKKVKESKKALELQVPETFSELSTALSRIFNRSSNRFRQIEFAKKESPKKSKKLNKEIVKSNEKPEESANSMTANRLRKNVPENNERVQRGLLPSDLSDSQRKYPERSKSRSAEDKDFKSDAEESIMNSHKRFAENHFETQPRKDKSGLLQSLPLKKFSQLGNDRRNKSLTDISSLSANHIKIVSTLNRRSKSDRELKYYDLKKRI